MLKVSIGHSEELDSGDAIDEVLRQCHETLRELQPNAGLLFTGIDHNFELILNKIYEAYPELELIGCTTDGELSSLNGFAEDSIVLTLFYSDELRFKAGVADRVSEDPLTNIKNAIETAQSSLEHEPVLCITTPSTFNINFDVVIDGLQQVLGDTFPIFGGLAGDQWRFQGTYQFYRNNLFTDAAPFLIIAGPLLFSFGVESGWIPIGKKGIVTQAGERVIYKIGDQSALDYYKYYLGDDIGTENMLPVGDYPLAVFEDNESFYLRAVPSFDKVKGSLTVGTNIPEGVSVQITHTTRDKIIEAAKMSVNSAKTNYPGSNPLIAICFTCAARKQVLGTRIVEEYEVLKNNFPDLPVTGFYTYGEIGPLKRSKPSRLHQETFLSLLLGLE
ncbi:MAG: FIST C-terminal domain-containing protein [Candidatus Latescibacteria bacterium]|nr:FIST C-terminal domain-containing protein [Candidatus Latescibacterota bacterium]